MNEKVYYNGNIITMDESNLTVEAILIGDNLIKGVGSKSELVKISPNAKLIDLKGKTMIPSFIDAHSHFSAVANSYLQISLEECYSFEDISEKISNFIQENNIYNESWIVCNSYDHNQLDEKRHPDKDFLDSILKSNPIVLQHKSGHMGVFNSKAIEILSINTSNGYLEETQFVEYLKKVPMSSVEDLSKAYEKAQNEYFSYGITTVQEGFFISQLIPIYKYLTVSPFLKLDIVTYVDIQNKDEIFKCFPNSIKAYNNHFKIGGYKIFLDGSPQGKTAWVKEPYINSDDYCGYGTMNFQEVERAINLASNDSMQILAHCNGDMAIEQYLRAIGKVLKLGKKLFRPVIVHAQFMDTSQLARVKQFRTIPSYFVGHIYYWGDTHIKNFGYDRAKKISPLKSTLKLNIPFTLHQDSPVIKPNMLETIWCAVNRVTKSGVKFDANETITPLQALKAVTINSAYQYGEEYIKGSITVGKFANLVVLDNNIMEVNPMDIKNIKILETIKDGQTVYKFKEN